ncbi:MAG: acyltransferase family protein [Variibacter sp.]|nr:acyltransferase family protein [Variibacter sp.]
MSRRGTSPCQEPSMATPSAASTACALRSPAEGRVGWVDYAKGICIIFVVMMHATLGVEAAAGHEGWMHHVVAFAKPFRMPDFFLISGLFLARVIDRDWTTYLDRKVVHFAYFYVLWVTIQFAFKAPGIAHEVGFAGVAAQYLWAFVEPFGTLWFIYLLPIFFVLTKLTRNVSPLAIWVLAAALEIAPVHTGSTVIDEFAARFVYFYTGYVCATRVFALAAFVQTRPALSFNLLTFWGFLNYALVQQGVSELPVVSLLMGLMGAMAVVTVSALIAMGDWFAALRYLGRNSIVVYLAFFLPMAMSRVALLKSGYITDVGAISLLVTAEGVIGALVMFWMAKRARLDFLFERPTRFRLQRKSEPNPRLALQPAE